MTCPAAAIRRTSSGSAWACAPSRKKVARTSWVARMSSSLGVQVAIRSVVEGERNLAGACGRSERAAKKPRTRPHGSIGIHACRDARARGHAQPCVNSGRDWRDHFAFRFASPSVFCIAAKIDNLPAPLSFTSSWHGCSRRSAALHASRPLPSAAWRVFRWNDAPAAKSSSKLCRSSTPR